MNQIASHRRRAVEDRLAWPMFVLTMLFLILLAGAIHRGRSYEAADWQSLEGRILFGGLVVLWPVFALESIVRFLLRDRQHRTWSAAGISLAIAAFPPLRLAARSVTRPGEHLWLPRVGWQEIDFDLQKTLERVFSGPMVFMALMILPVLAVEYFWSDAIESRPGLRIVLVVSVALIWIAFTTEFIIRISAADRKLAYAFNHWIDLAVVLVPTLEFLPFLRVLRVARVARLDTLARLAKYYRLYGLAGKSWRGLVVLQLIRQLFSRSPEARLGRLRSHLEGKQEELRLLEREIDYYCRRIKKLEQERTAPQPQHSRTADPN